MEVLYGVHDGEWGSDVYDDVESFLEFSAHFREETEEDVKKAIAPSTKTPLCTRTIYMYGGQTAFGGTEKPLSVSAYERA